MATQTRYFPLGGGLNLMTPAIQTPPGHAIAGLNYEPAPRGYQRVDGFERLDGRPRPSDASYWVLRFENGDTEVEEDDIVEGATSGATGRAVINGVVESGDYGTSDAAGFLVLTNLTGEFQDGDVLEVASSKVAEADGAASDRGALTDENDATWFQSAIEKARADIEAVPGSGPVRGVWVYGGDTYAFRDNAGGTEGIMHKATAAGWAAQDLGSEIAFENGTGEFTEGSTLTGGTSGATATIERVVLQSGGWSENNAAGRLILSGVMGTFQNGEAITDAASGAAEADGTVSVITLPPGGRYDLANHNFFGSSDLERMYGVNGVGRGFEYDGEVFVPIQTGMADDRPTRVAVHRNHLFFAYRGGSLQHSSLGDPYQWQVLTGAGEIGIGEEITDLLASVSGVLAVFGLNKVAVLYGDDAENWVLRTLSDDAGAVGWTAQMIGTPVYLDSRGLRTMDATEAFGDFLLGTITQMIEPLFRVKRRAGVTPVGSLRVRAKDQYRLFWSDGSGISVYFGRKTPEILPFDLGFAITCAASGKDDQGRERLFVGNDEGMVYELDAGTSFDGEPVPAFLRLPFNHVGSPAQRKRWQKASLEIDGGPNTLLGLTAEFGYADPDQPAAQEQRFSVRGSGGFWNEFSWDNFYWSSPVEGQAEAPIDGLGRNISITVVSNATYETPHVLHGLIMHFSFRGLVR